MKRPSPSSPRRRRTRRVLAVAAASLALAASAPGQELSSAPSLSFVENLGQWDTPAPFVAQSGPTVLRVLEDGFVVDVELPDQEAGGGPAWVHLGFELECADAVVPRGEAPLPGRRDWLVGPREDWVLGARAYAAVVWPGVAAGVDLRLRDGGGLPEYDLLVAPGADLEAVVLRCDGARGLALDEEGGLLLETPSGVLRQSPPRTWSVLPDGSRRAVDCAFVLLDDQRYGFRLDAHDPTLPVVVDPGLEWASYLGGSSRDFLWELDLGPSGELALCGETLSIDFPATGGPPTLGSRDAWVAIADPSGSTLLHSIVLGGSGDDFGNDVKVAADGRVYVAGWTGSPDLPTTAGAWDATLGGPWDGFLVELTPSGTMPAVSYATSYLTYVGDAALDAIGSLQLDGPRTVVLAGCTASKGLTTTPGSAQPVHGGGLTDFFVYRLVLGDAATPSVLDYGTFLGGSANDGTWSIYGVSGQRMKEPQLERAADGTLTLAGRTYSPDIVRSAGAWDAVLNTAGSTASQDGYVAVLDLTQPGTAGVLWDSYVGGDLGDGARVVVRDAAGVVTVAGFTDSPDLPTTLGAFDTAFAGAAPAHDGFVLRLDPSLPPAQQLLYGTFLGGDGYENVLGLALDGSGRVLASGYTTASVSEAFPTTPDAFQPVKPGGDDGFLVYLDLAGAGPQDLLHATFLGGSSHDTLSFELRLLEEAPGHVTVLCSGKSGQGGLPAPETWGWQASPAGLEDGLVLRLRVDGALETQRLGTPPNPAALLPGVTSGPVIGHTWDPVVDHATFLPGALVDLLYVTSGPLNLDLPPHGTLLLNPATLILGKATPAGVPFALPIPWDHAFCGLELHTQAASGDGVQVLLTNALDVRIGAF